MRVSVVGARGLSSCGFWALESRLSSCGARASLLRGVWELPGPGLEPLSPTLAGGFLTTAPPGKPYIFLFIGHLQTRWGVKRSSQTNLPGKGKGSICLGRKTE